MKKAHVVNTRRITAPKTIPPEIISCQKRKTTSLYVKYGVGEGVCAYFIDPGGRSINVNTSHIDKVIQDPEYFGLSLQNIETLHKKYHEKLGVEGKARGVILQTLIRNGWIRVRYNAKLDIWNFTVWKLGRREKNHIDKWIAKMFTHNLVTVDTEYAAVTLIDDATFASKT